MSLDAIPDAVRALLKEHMTSFERLEILLLLNRMAGSDVTLAAVCAGTGIREDLAREALTGLCASRLVATGAAPASFRYQPASDDRACAVDALAATYREHSAAVLSTMSIDAIERIRSGSVRAFADAFVLRKDQND